MYEILTSEVLWTKKSLRVVPGNSPGIFLLILVYLSEHRKIEIKKNYSGRSRSANALKRMIQRWENLRQTDKIMKNERG